MPPTSLTEKRMVRGSLLEKLRLNDNSAPELIAPERGYTCKQKDKVDLGTA
jgi:hypothetical protein